MAIPERRRDEADQPTLVEGGVAIRGPGSRSSSDALNPADLPTSVDDHPSDAESPAVPAGKPNARTAPEPIVRVIAPILEQGSLLGQRYEILELLGQGGMGAVYKARDRELNRLVALKVIRPELASKHSMIERFKQELILSHQVTHRNVIRIYDLAEAQGLKFITMEFIEGQDLRSIIHDKTKLPPEEAVEIIRQVCFALDAAHCVGIIHRDLKPQNIMRDRSGRVVVMDFGLARTLEGAGMTQTGALVGTLEYMSPEQALGKDLDQRSDLFAAGLILYEMLTGKVPYAADSVLASLIKRTQERAVPVSDHDSSIPAALSGIVSRCLERDLNLRYQNVGEILQDLEAWQGKQAAATLRFHHATPLGKTPPWPLLAAIVVVLAVTLAGVVFRYRLFEGSAKHAAVQAPVTSLAILPFRNASGDPTLDWLGSSLGQMLTTDVGESAGLRPVSPNRLNQVLADLHLGAGSALDPSNVRRVADFSGADLVVWGQYARFGDHIRIDATVQDLKHERSAALKTEASGQGDLLAAIDRLAQSIRENLALPPELVKELQQQSFKPSSKSLDALRFYNEGLEFARKGDNEEALKRLQDSVKADPDFALGYARLAQTYANLGYDNEADQASRRSVDLSQNLPAREKYLISANRARINNDNPKAIETYETLLKVSPNDPDLLSELAGLYSASSAFDKARELYKKLLEQDPKNVEDLLAMGRLEIRSGNSQGSLDALNRALTLAIQLDNQEERAAVLNAIGVAYMQLNKPDDAMRYMQDSLVIKRRLGQKKSIAISLNTLAQLQATLGKREAALSSYQEALQIRRDIGDKKGVGDTLIDLGGYYQDAGLYDEALKLYKESLQIQRDVGNENYQALCLNNIGLAYLSEGDYDNARTYFEQALPLRQKFNVPGDTADTLHNLAETSAKTGQFDKALDQYLQALQLYRTADDKSGAARESYSMGTIFEYQGRYGAAVSSKQDALKTFRELQDRSFWMAEILGGYGHSLAQAGRGDEAQANFSEALSLARELKNQGLIAQTLDFQGDSLFYRGDLRGARRLYEEALQVASHGNDRPAKLLASLDVFKLEVRDGPPQRAIAGLKSLAQETDSVGLKYLSIDASLSLAQAQLALKSYSQARQELERALIKSDKLGLRALTAQAHYLLGNALRLSGNANDAEPHYKEAVRLLDEIGKEAGANKVLGRSDLQSMYTESRRWVTSTKS